ncbi:MULTISPECIES: hypothetical protein [unclassified Streptomyces]|uniref:hypothetical protein n=1 Tax=unclassified Streptomyces TaxID=2593676 RepID=UPI00224DDEF1|nr:MULTISPECIES: hypothetical protein [unclassified Streptomyces]MCX4406103.1 glycosyltransferase [Streptomyces sp. NBC_01764]MCX5189372.1 glycosyltransferase [Streptomyces sp. NBC_00268]
MDVRGQSELTLFGHNAGSEWTLHSMLRPLAARGHQVSVWLSHPGESEKTCEIDGVRIVPLKFHSAQTTSDQHIYLSRDK